MTIIKIDWDRRKYPNEVVYAFGQFLSALNWTPFAIQTTRSRRHWHITVELPVDLRPEQIVGLQLFFGSDPDREFYNLFRVTRKGAPAYWRKRWNVFFKKEGAK